jgi:hypothetical protein
MEVENSLPPTNTIPPLSTDLEQGDRLIKLTKEEYRQLLDKLQQAEDDKNYSMLVLTKQFWDRFFCKLFAMFISVKLWLLIFFLYVPYQLVVSKHITGDNYVSIMIVVAPLLVGLRELSKIGSDKNGSSQGEQQTSVVGGIINATRKIFKV